MSKIVIVDPNAADCPHCEYTFDENGSGIHVCLISSSDDNKAECNNANCPLKDFDEWIKEAWTAGFHTARNEAVDDWEDEKLFQRWRENYE